MRSATWQVALTRPGSAILVALLTVAGMARTHPDRFEMRQPIVGGNWKMNLDAAGSAHLARQVAAEVDGDVRVVLFPAFCYLLPVGKILGDTPVALGAQDFYDRPNGAFTGEVSLAMLRDVGVTCVLAGHSERRHVLGESDQIVNRKVLAALEAGFEVVLCVGETLEQRQAGRADTVNEGQVREGLAGVDSDTMSRVTIAYEPVWAIGTGRTATPEDAQSAHHAVRRTVEALFSAAVAQATRIQYGGSVKASNAADLFAQEDVDGGLIGSASLTAEDFIPIVRAAAGA